jgi:hypothetical protein
MVGRALGVERKRGAVDPGGLFDCRAGELDASSKLNTSFVERLNLTIRQGWAYLFRRTLCYARWKERLEGHLSCFAAITTLSGLTER